MTIPHITVWYIWMTLEFFAQVAPSFKWWCLGVTRDWLWTYRLGYPHACARSFYGSRWPSVGEGEWLFKIPVWNFKKPDNSKFESDLQALGPSEKVRKIMPEVVGMTRGTLWPGFVVLVEWSEVRRNWAIGDTTSICPSPRSQNLDSTI